MGTLFWPLLYYAVGLLLFFDNFVHNKFSDLQFMMIFIVGVVGFNKRVWVFFYKLVWFV